VVFTKVDLGQINTAAAAVGGTLTNPAQNVPASYITLSLITLLLSVPGDPSVPQRALCGDSVKTVKRAFNISAVITAIMGAVMTFVGCGIMAIMPDLKEVYGTTESSFPLFIINYFPPVLKGLGISALMAAVVSTVTSMLLVGTSHLVYDAGQALFPNISDSKFKSIMPLAIVVVGGLITWISLSVQSIVSVLYFAFSVCGAALVMPMFLVLYWKKTSSWGVTIGMLLGLAYVLAVQFLGWVAPGGDSVYVGLVLSVIGTIAGSLLIPDKKAATALPAEGSTK
jgi:Na+/proline symporter